MGQNAYLIAKKKDGSYVSGYVDRMYHFVFPIGDEERALEGDVHYTFKEMLEWSQSRLKVLETITEEELLYFSGRERAIDKIHRMQRFLLILNEEEIEWMVISDSINGHYSQVIFDQEPLPKVIEIDLWEDLNDEE